MKSSTVYIVRVSSICAVGEAWTATLCQRLLWPSLCHKVQLVCSCWVRHWSFLLLQPGTCQVSLSFSLSVCLSLWMCLSMYDCQVCLSVSDFCIFWWVGLGRVEDSRHLFSSAGKFIHLYWSSNLSMLTHPCNVHFTMFNFAIHYIFRV